ncbi:MAG: GNAT family N-acetyltransferase [Anaerolinea sp.]|nr:GNAT family N-acetyltransferase [Anaerolinea sp.]
MATPVIQGPRIQLRPARASDREERRALGHAPEVARGFGVTMLQPAEMTAESADAWFARLSAEAHAWVIDLGGRFIGTLTLHSFVRADSRASLAVAIFDASLLGQGIGTEAVALAVRHAFEELDLHRLSIRVLASNTRAVRCYEKCGFKVEGRERESARVGDSWEDDLTMGLLREEWLTASAT